MANKQAKFTVIAGPLDHDGKRHEDGDVVELDTKIGERLVQDQIVAEGVVKLDKPAAEGNDA